MANSNKAAKVLIGFILGVAAGAAAGVLMAPDKGKNTRKKLKKQAEDLKDNLVDTYGKYKEEVKEAYDNFAKKVSKKDPLEEEFEKLSNNK